MSNQNTHTSTALVTVNGLSVKPGHHMIEKRHIDDINKASAAISTLILLKQELSDFEHVDFRMEIKEARGGVGYGE